MKRENLKNMLGEFTPMHVHTKKLAAADEHKLVMGNSNQVPPITVVQKISSPKKLENRMDINPFLGCLKKIQESQDADQQFALLKDHYLQCVTVSPFTLHMYTITQLQLLKDLQKDTNLLLYLDATQEML